MIGTTVGPYRVMRKIGEGGMGAVYEALHESIERRVALKVLHPKLAADPELARRFFNEARAVNRVDHPGLVQITDFGHIDDTAYIVMELLHGETLGARLRQLSRPMAIADVLAIARQVADALAAAHSRGVVHRDLKPDNVMLIADPYMQRKVRTKLLDFGIAKLDTSKDIAWCKTLTHSLLGTPAYMSPEQCRGAGHVDDKSDVYSFGVLLYTMLTGEPPFTGAGMGELIGKHLYEEPPALASRLPWVPERITLLVHSLLNKDKELRPPMRQVAGELQSLSQRAPTPRRPLAAATPMTAPASRPSVPDVELVHRDGLSGPTRSAVRPWRPTLLKAGVLFVLGMVGGFGVPIAADLVTAKRHKATECRISIRNVSERPEARGFPERPQNLRP